ncbi:MAG: hypothetical protein ACFE9S_02085 [Candidatus Hermodarchaeota archaeon]
MKFNIKYLSITSAFIAFLSYYLFSIISISYFPTSFNPLTDLWTHLRWYNYNPTGAYYFRIGNIIFGIFLIPYFIGWSRWYEEDEGQKVKIQIFQGIGYILTIIIILNEILADINVLFYIFSIFLMILIILITAFPPILLFKHPKFIKLILIYVIIILFLNIYLAYLIIADALIVEFRSIELITVILNHGYFFLMAFNTMKL